MCERFLALNIPSINGSLWLTELTGEDYLSSPFFFELTVLTDNENLSTSNFLGKTATIQIGQSNSAPQYYNGIVSDAIKGNASKEIKSKTSHKKLNAFTLTISPWLSNLEDEAINRIYCADQPMTIPELVTSIFNRYGYTDYDTSQLSKQYEPINFCVQYDETAFNFVSRLLQRAGIYYYFKHTQDKHTLILEDSGYLQNSYPNDVTFHESPEQKEHLFKWRHESSFAATNFSLANYDFKNPSSAQEENATIKKNIAPQLTQYYYITQPMDSSSLSREVNLMARSEVLQANKIDAASNFHQFYAGMSFNLTQHPNENENSRYYIYAICHEAHDTTNLKTGASEHDTAHHYQNRFKAYSSDTLFTPQARYCDYLEPTSSRLTINKVTPSSKMSEIYQPIASGAQLAIVVGPKEKEIYTDQYGRVKVQFLWDRDSKEDENSSYWIRTKQHWASNGFGTQFLPRVGQAVLVGFEDGELDRPIVIGDAANENNKLPFNPAETPTQSGIKSHSFASDNNDDANILRFEDQAGKEETLIHAQKDLKEHAGNDSSKIILGKSTTTLNQGNQFSDIKNEMTIQAENEIHLVCGKSDITISSCDITLQSDAIHYAQSASLVLPKDSNDPKLASLDEARDNL